MSRPISRPDSMSSAGAGAPVYPGSNASKSPFLEQAETQERLQRAQENKSRTQSELHSLVRARSTTPHMSPFEIQKKDSEIASLRHHLYAMDLKIKELSEKAERDAEIIRKQQATIRTQSKQIEQPGGCISGPFYPNMPALQSSYGSIMPSVNNQPLSAAGQQGFGRAEYSSSPSAPSYTASTQIMPQAGQRGLGSYPFHSTQNGPGISHTSLQRGSDSTWGPPGSTHSNRSHVDVYNDSKPSYHGSNMNYQHINRVTDEGSPRAFRQHNPVTPGGQMISAPATQAFTPSHVTSAAQDDPFTGKSTLRSPPSSEQRQLSMGNASYQSPAGPNGYQNQQALVPYGAGAANASSSPAGRMVETPLVDAIHNGLDEVFLMAKNYAFNHVNFVNTSGDNSLPAAVKDRLLKTAGPRAAFPLAKSPETRYWLVTKVILVWIVKHIFKDTAFTGLDKAVDDLINNHHAMVYHSTPPQLRFLYLQNVRNHIKSLANNPDFSSFFEGRVKERAEALYWIVRPMAHQPTPLDMEDMTSLIRQAHQVAQLVYSSTDEYKFHFFEAGPPDCSYDPFRMRNVDPKYCAHPDDVLGRWRANIRLCATPEVTMRENHAHGTGQETQVHKARVLLKIKGADY